MGKNPSLLAVERVQIMALHMERLSQLQCSKSSVLRVIEKFKKHEIYNDIKKIGRPRKTARRDDHTIRRAVIRSQTSFCR